MMLKGDSHAADRVREPLGAIGGGDPGLAQRTSITIAVRFIAADGRGCTPARHRTELMHRPASVDHSPMDISIPCRRAYPKAARNSHTPSAI